MAIVAPSPGLYASVLHALRSADPRERTIPTALGDVVNALTNEEAEQLPAAIGGVLPLLSGDIDRLRFAAEALVRFDLYEAANEVATAAEQSSDRDLLLSAASLCGNPAVDVGVRERVVEALQGDRIGLIRLDPGVRPATEAETLLYQQRWPGSRRADGSRLAPVVVLDEQLGPGRVLRFALTLYGAGAVVRRLSPKSLVPDWFGDETVVCCDGPTRSRILSARPQFPERQILFDVALATESDTASTLRRIDSALPSRSRLRLDRLGIEMATTVWNPEVYSLGVYETREAAFLTAAPTSTLYRLARESLLHPRQDAVTTWAFSDLVAVRAWRYLNAHSVKRVSRKVLPALAEFAGDPAAVKVGATSNGKVFVDRGDGWVDVRTGEALLDLPIADLDDAFRPFTIGGHSAPDMLRASANTRLHPAVLHGTPYLKGHRISAAVLARLDDRGGRQAIDTAYPELDAEAIDDTIVVGRQLVGAR